MTEIFSCPKNILENVKGKKVQLFVFFMCGFSYLLLYSFFQKENILSPLEWQDCIFHLRVITLLKDQSTYIPYIEDHPIPYPVFFHNVVRVISTAFDLKLETALLLVSCLASFGATFLVFLIISEISKDRLAGLMSAVILGVGANFVVFFSETIFFGGAFIFPTAYLVAGFLPNIMGHFFGLSMLYTVARSRLQRWSHVIFCALLGTLLVLNHTIASVTYLVALACLFVSSYMANERIEFKKFGIILFLSIVISSLWWSNIIEELLRRPQLLMLSDAGKCWIQYGLSTEVINYYGFIPLFSFLGILHFRVSKIGNFLSLWLAMLFPLLFTRWGFRFALELVVPLYMLGTVGVSRILRQVFSREHRRPIVCLIIFILVVAVLCDSLRLFDLLLIKF